MEDGHRVEAWLRHVRLGLVVCALLAALPEKERGRLWPRLEAASMGIKALVHESGEPIRHVYFPLSGVFSLVVVMSDGLAVEIGTVGNEGMVGLSVFLGDETSPYRGFAQVPGESLRMPAEDFKEELDRAKL